MNFPSPASPCLSNDSVLQCRPFGLPVQFALSPESSTEPNTYDTKGKQTSLDPANLYQPDDPDIDPYQRATSLPYDKMLFSLPSQLTTGSLDYFSDTIYSTETTFTMSDSAVFIDKSVNSSKGLQEYPWPVKREAVVEGDLVIGGLMMVHEREDSITCGPIMPQGGIQALETMLYTIDQINANKLINMMVCSLQYSRLNRVKHTDAFKKTADRDEFAMVIAKRSLVKMQ
ncbi:unnamed protein product [Diabrotica balteata]|uniref:Uncharacterized protein n=1 Tax=Diabrotica balteata TaxID=107213 RepID=A0A9N9T8T7_DIABA|nr:unnamed protein product [Diabrotica balteata]